MSPRQLNLFPETQRDLEAAIHTFNRRGVPHKHFVALVHALASAIKSSQPGATFILGCAPDRGFDEFIDATMLEVRRSFPAGSDGQPDFTNMQVRAPGSVSAKQLRVELLDRYRTELQCASIRYRHRPQFLSGDACGIAPRTDLGQLVGLLGQKRPSLVIVRDIHNLARPGAPQAEAAAALRVLMDLAAQSGVTHLIGGSVSSALDLLDGHTSLLEAVEAFILRPYDLHDEVQKACFSGTVQDYDRELPWSGKDRLAAKLQYLDNRIHGDPDRLRKWIKRALSHALASGAEKLAWHHIEQTGPHWGQVVLAKDEFRRVGEFFGHSDAGTEHPTVSQKAIVQRKPPRQKERRDHVAA